MLTFTIVVLGVVTVVLSLCTAVAFRRYSAGGRGAPGKLSGALSWQLWGEAVIGAGTLLFSVAAHNGWLSDWSEATQSSIRFAMFAATASTTAHLWYTLVRISKGRV